MFSCFHSLGDQGSASDGPTFVSLTGFDQAGGAPLPSPLPPKWIRIELELKHFSVVEIKVTPYAISINNPHT